MPSTSIPLTFRAAPFPEGYKAGPEQFKNDLVARLYAESSEAISFFAAGSIAPSSNVGPWLKNGTTWYVWDNGLAMYVPQLMESQSLGYIAQVAEPDPDIYTFWIELDGSGQAISIQYYWTGAWHDIYEVAIAAIDASIAAVEADITTIQGDITTIQGQVTTLESEMNTAQADIDAIEANLSTNYTNTVGMTAAIAASAASTLSSSQSYTNSQIAALTSYPAQATCSAQVIAIDGAPHKMDFSTTSINPSPGPFDTTNKRYIAPAAGIYNVSVATQFDNSTGAAAGMQVGISLYKNGSFVGNSMADLDSTPSPNGARWSPGFSGLVQMVLNDYLEVFAEITDGVDLGNITVTVAQFSINRVSA